MTRRSGSGLVAVNPYEQPASLTQSGYVTTGAQSLAGVKTFTDMPVLPSAVVAYTPTWVAAPTSPVIGNGTLSGTYQIMTGKICKVRIFIAPGSTTTFGSGYYQIGLPFNADGTVKYINGTGWLQRGLSQSYMATIVYGDVGYVYAITDAQIGLAWSPADPYTFASGDKFTINLEYRMA